jgi:hypothetical protein
MLARTNAREVKGRADTVVWQHISYLPTNAQLYEKFVLALCRDLRFSFVFLFFFAFLLFPMIVCFAISHTLSWVFLLLMYVAIPCATTGLRA